MKAASHTEAEVAKVLTRFLDGLRNRDVDAMLALFADDPDVFTEHPEQPVRVRIGLHSGEPVREGNDFYGKSVVLASRIAGQARGGEVLISSLLHNLVESAGDIRFNEGREVTLKGRAGAHRLYAVSLD